MVGIRVVATLCCRILRPKRVRSWNKQIMDYYSRSVLFKREATFISLWEAEMAVKRKGFIESLWMENKNFLQKLLKDDCICWRLEPVFEDKRVLRKDFGTCNGLVWSAFLIIRVRCWNKQIMVATVDLCHLKGKPLSFHLEKRRWQSREKGF
nr:hypothetical protein CFP56_71397 [Quercus suber]